MDTIDTIDVLCKTDNVTMQVDIRKLNSQILLRLNENKEKTISIPYSSAELQEIIHTKSMPIHEYLEINLPFTFQTIARKTTYNGNVDEVVNSAKAGNENAIINITFHSMIRVRYDGSYLCLSAEYTTSIRVFSENDEIGINFNDLENTQLKLRAETLEEFINVICDPYLCVTKYRNCKFGAAFDELLELYTSEKDYCLAFVEYLMRAFNS